MTLDRAHAKWIIAHPATAGGSGSAGGSRAEACVTITAAVTFARGGRNSVRAARPATIPARRHALQRSWNLTAGRASLRALSSPRRSPRAELFLLGCSRPVAGDRLLVRHLHPRLPRDVPRLRMAAASACRKTPSQREMITGSEADSGRRWSASPATTVHVLPLLCAALALGAAPGARAGLLRVPRVYNALITTDERLLPSRAVSVSAPLLPVTAPLIIGPAPVASLAALAAPAPAPAPVRAAASPNATQERPDEPAPAPAPAPAAGGNATARLPAEKEAVAPLAPTLLPLYSPYYSYYPSLLPYSLAPHPLSSLVLFHPFLPPAPAAAPAGPAPPTDPSGRALPPGAKDEPEKDAVSVEA